MSEMERGFGMVLEWGIQLVFSGCQIGVGQAIGAGGQAGQIAALGAPPAVQPGEPGNEALQSLAAGQWVGGLRAHGRGLLVCGDDLDRDPVKGVFPALSHQVVLGAVADVDPALSPQL